MKPTGAKKRILVLADRTVVRHVYDVDAFETLDKLKEKYLKHIDSVQEHLKDLEFIKEEEKMLIKQFKDYDFDLTENQKHRNFIIPSNYNQYCTYLGYKLLTIDVYKIEPLLSYQSVLFMGNYYAVRDNFIGLIEFVTYDFVKARLLPFEKKRLEKIVNWLERNRMALPITNLKKKKSQNSEVQTMETKVLVKIDAQFAKILCEKLNCFFEGQEQLLYNLIFKKEFTVPLVFNGQDNQLAELFKRLRYNAKIDVASLKVLAEWITANFSSVNENGVVEEINFNTIHQVLKKQDREPPKTKRILTEIAPYVMPDDRKTYKAK